MAESGMQIGRGPQDDLISEEKVSGSENRWLAVIAAMLTSMFIIMVVVAGVYSMQPPSNVERIDPAKLHIAGEFVESNLGTVIEPDGSATVRVVAAQYSFSPGCIMVPAGRKIRFRVTSPDVIHGFLLYKTNVNTMVVPGYVSQAYTLFPKPGEYNMPCHEFCGIGHQAMWAHVKVIDARDWPATSNQARVSCDKS